MQPVTNKLKPMKQRRFFVVSLFCLLAVFAGPQIAYAQPFAKENARSENYFNQAPGISRKEAARQARNATQGKVIAIKPISKGSRGYNVRLVVDGGRVVTVRVDQSGKVHRK